MKTHDEMLHKWMQDPAFDQEYRALAEEFALVDELLRTQKVAGLMQAEVAANAVPNHPERNTP